MNKIESEKELKAKLVLLENEHERIKFLENFLKKSENLSLELIAFIYEELGALYCQTGKPKAHFYKKASSMWELLSTMGERNAKSKKDILKRALEDCRIASSIYRKENSRAEFEELRVKENNLRKELRSYNSPVKTIIILAVMLCFIISFFLLSSPLTGLVLAPLDIEESANIGIIIGVLAIAGMIFIWKWLS